MVPINSATNPHMMQRCIIPAVLLERVMVRLLAAVERVLNSCPQRLLVGSGPFFPCRMRRRWTTRP